MFARWGGYWRKGGRRTYSAIIPLMPRKPATKLWVPHISCSWRCGIAGCPIRPRFLRTGGVTIAAWLIFFLLSIPACALEPTTPLANLNRQSWVMENGLPQNTIQALAQTADGFLWLGTEAGLVRFDGVQFAVFDRNSKPALPGNDIRALLATPDGVLWIGTGDGLARLDRGALTVFTIANGLPSNSVRRLLPGSQASVLVETDNGDARVEAGRAILFPESANADKLGATLPGGETAEASQGILTLTRANKIEVRLKAGQQLPGTRIQTLLADSQGALWIGTNRGLARWVAGKLDRLPQTDPLAIASVLNLLEDREGNLWVGTETSGLHVLRDQRFAYIGAREGLSSDSVTAITQDSTGRLWVGTNGGGLNSIRLTPLPNQVTKPGEPSIYSLHFGLLSKIILSLAAGPNNELWVGTPDGLNRFRGGAIDAFTSADGLPDDFIRSLRVDKDGSLWVGTRRGLAHWSFSPDGREVASRHLYTTSNGLRSNLVGALARDTHGDLWIATLGGLSRLHAGKITTYTTADGLSSNIITSLLARPDGTLFIGTEDHGWNLWDGSAFHPIAHPDANGGVQTTGVHAILDDGLGHLWLTTTGGIARCDIGLLNPAHPPTSCPNWVEFGPSDGLRSRETAAIGHPSAWRSASGRLWFATPKGLLTLSPALFPVNSVQPPVVIERFAVDDFDQPVSPTNASNAPLRVAAEHVHFQFDYAALSFTAPQKVRYRYMLEGFDKTWTEAGARRTAYYTNIPPGSYTFRVQAANNDGVWNTTGASLAFELRPHYYQTPWFYAALVLALILLAVVITRYRLSRAEREFRAVLAERGRIAREIHDTLAQGYVGVSVQLEVLSELLRRNRLDAAQKHLDSTRESVRAGLADARQSIWALRSQDSAETTLPVRLRRITEEGVGRKLNASFAIYGAYRPLAPTAGPDPSPDPEQEILRIAQEAIQNAVRHARASISGCSSTTCPRSSFSKSAMTASALPLPRPRIESPQGHYGLTGMRERAESIGATIELTSAPGQGATIRLTLPTAKVSS